MKKQNLFLTVSFAIIVMGLTNCTKHDQVLDLSNTTPTPVLNTDTLYSVKGTATVSPIGGAAWDGTIESVWNNAPSLTVHGVVPDVGNNIFTGFVGNSTDIKMRSMYDASYFYMLVEYDAANKGAKSQLWYYNPSTQTWGQEAEAPTLNSDGETYRPASIQDQFVIAFNIANSTPGFNKLSCYAACHVFSGFGDPVTPGGGNMYTSGPNEMLDVWRIHVLQVLNCNQGRDTYIDWAGGVLNGNGRHNDPKASSSDGTFDNVQTLTITGTTTTEDVPLWVIPSGNYTNSAIPLSATLTGGTAVQVTAVDTNGVLTLANATTIDPRTGTDYMQVGAGNGPKCIPGIIVTPYTGSFGDLNANAFYTGTGWRMLIKRKLTTSDAVRDIDLSSLNDQPFGVGVMFNGADNEHAIVAGLTLHFK